MDVSSCEYTIVHGSTPSSELAEKICLLIAIFDSRNYSAKS